MKSSRTATPMALLSVWMLAYPVSAAATSDRTITKVVKLLEGMMEASKTDGENERDLYAKYKCYCDTNEASKKESIAKTEEEIGLLENGIEALQASSAELSKDVAKLKKDMEDNVASRDAALTLRGEENTAFLALEKDLTESIAAMSQAITTLADVGADQSLSVGADHTQYMAGEGSLLKLKTTVKQALVAASAVLSKKQMKSMQSFVQGPFTGTYTAQAGEVVGILKDMKDTFTSNLDSARATEEAALKSYNAFIQVKEKEHGDMLTSSDAKKATLSSNDSDLSTKTGQLDVAQKSLADDQSFLAQLLDMCSAKAKQYQERTLLRTNEESAISEAIAILNSDAAFATFGSVAATKTGATSFLQQRNIRKHEGDTREQQRETAKAFLRKASAGKKMPLLSRAMALLQANNPFAVVLDEISKMIDLIAVEEKSDQDQYDWCVSERATNNQDLDAKKADIISLEGSINALVDAIETPLTGLKDQIAQTEADLQTNYDDKTTETKDRTEDNLDYQKNIANLVEAQKLLTKAVKVLNAYYKKILNSDAAALLAMSHSRRAAPAPPSSWEDKYSGQSQTGGTDAISMLEFILKNTADEETAAHEAERSAQHQYEDSMKSLKDQEARLLQSKITLVAELAQKEKDLVGKREDLETTTKDKEAIEAYLLKIKDGCDFIEGNLVDRQNNRQNEKSALENARDALKGSPVYTIAVAEQEKEDLGECADICAQSMEDIKCKACLAQVTEPAYCAGHPGTVGCP